MRELLSKGERERKKTRKNGRKITKVRKEGRKYKQGKKRKVTVEWEQEIRDERLVHNFHSSSLSLSSNKLIKNLIINIDCYNYERWKGRIINHDNSFLLQGYLNTKSSNHEND